jgi:hypothetical protein
VVNSEGFGRIANEVIYFSTFSADGHTKIYFSILPHTIGLLHITVKLYLCMHAYAMFIILLALRYHYVLICIIYITVYKINKHKRC